MLGCNCLLHPAQLAYTALCAPAGGRSASIIETFKMPIKLLAQATGTVIISLLLYGIPLQFQSISLEKNVHMTKLWVQQHPEEVSGQSPRTEWHLQLLYCHQTSHSILVSVLLDFQTSSSLPVMPPVHSSQPQGPSAWPCIALKCQHPLTAHGMGN